MYNNGGIPEKNSLKEEIRSLLEWCEKKESEGELGRTFFDAPIEEDKMTKWEEKNGVKIPESYKEWLRFSEKCWIDGTTAAFWGPDEFHSEYVQEDLVVIGAVIGDGEVVCFSKETGEFVRLFESRRTGYKSFDEIVSFICKTIDASPILSEEEYHELLEKIKAKKEAEKKS